MQIPQADWSELVVIWAPFERQKIEAYIFERANLSGVGTVTFTSKEDLIPRKQVFLLNLRLWPVQKTKMWSIIYGKKFISENSVLWKLRAFGLKIITFPRLLIVPIRNTYINYGLVTGMWHKQTQKVGKSLVVKLQTM